MSRPVPRPVPQYLFRRRRDRRRVAQALASGLPVAMVARIERAEPLEIERLLGERSFQALVEHYRSDGESGREARLERIAAVALDLLELAIESGDVRAAIFFLAERRCGRDPGRTIAEAVVRSIERAEASLRTRAEALPAEDSAASGAEAGGSRRHALAPSDRPVADRVGDRYAFCAAVQRDPAAAEALAAAELRGFRRRMAEITRRLGDRVTTEMERIGTAELGSGDENDIRTFARIAHAEPEAALGAARSLEARREAAAALARTPAFDYDAVARSRRPLAPSGISRSDDPWGSRAAPSDPPPPACRDSP